MGRISAKSERLAMFHGDDPTACIGAIERTRSSDLPTVRFEGHSYQIPYTGLRAKARFLNFA
jgi:hypothetical protein